MRIPLLVLLMVAATVAPAYASHPVDSDGDLVPDTSELIYGSNPWLSDTDGDGLPDGVENINHDEARNIFETDATSIDTDGDGLKDGVEDANKNGAVERSESDPRLADTDSDGVKDGVDNCPRKENFTQADWDFDGLGDVCDRDAYVTLHLRNTAGRMPRIVRVAGRRYARVELGRVLLLRGAVVPKDGDGQVEIRVSFRSCRKSCPYTRLGYIATAAREGSSYKRGYRFSQHGYYLLQAVLSPGAYYDGDETIVQRVIAG